MMRNTSMQADWKVIGVDKKREEKKNSEKINNLLPRIPWI